MKKSILITGSNGLLGQALVDKLILDKHYNIYGVSRGKNLIDDLPGFSYFQMDLTNASELNRVLEKIKPQVIINTAAMTNVDQCELQPDLCDRINVDVVRALTDFSVAHNVHLIQLSTDFIFDGKKGFYKETDPPSPLNHYGYSKLLSENILRESGVEHTIIRTILVFGRTRNMKNNIVLWLIRELREGNKVRIVTDQFRMPTPVDLLVDSCIHAMKNAVTGTFHVSTNELMSIFDIANAVADTFDLDKTLILPITTDELNQPAKRPFKTGFDLNKSIEQLDLPLISFKESIQVFKNQIKGF